MGKFVFTCAAVLSLLVLLLVGRMWQISYRVPSPERPYRGSGPVVWNRSAERQYVSESQRGHFHLHVFEGKAGSKDVTVRKVADVPYWMPALAASLLPLGWVLRRKRRGTR